MNKQTPYFIAAFVVALPALILFANLCAFAFVGAGFLPIGDEGMRGARLVIAYFSSTVAILICAMGATA